MQTRPKVVHFRGYNAFITNNNVCVNSMDKRLTGLKCTHVRWRRKYSYDVERTVSVASV
jgi:hypothetical protein